MEINTKKMKIAIPNILDNRLLYLIHLIKLFKCFANMETKLDKLENKKIETKEQLLMIKWNKKSVS